MQGAMDWVKRAQATSLLAGYERTDREEQASPYVQLGDTKLPFDLNVPGVVRELKLALKALGQRAADRHRTPDPALETRWQRIIIDEEVPSWDGATADEFAIAIGRYRGWGWQVPEPYARSSAGGPQPTAGGLELIAGGVHQLLGGVPRMSFYESWRNGTFDPPSRISCPPANAPIVPVSYFGSDHIMAPATTAPDIAMRIEEAERMLSDAHAEAMVATTEEERSYHANTMIAARSIRNIWVAEAQAQAPERQGETTLDPPLEPDACAKLGGHWDAATGTCAPPAKASVEPSSAAPWIILAVGGLLVAGAYLTKDKPASPSRLSGKLGSLR